MIATENNLINLTASKFNYKKNILFLSLYISLMILPILTFIPVLIGDFINLKLSWNLSSIPLFVFINSIKYLLLFLSGVLIFKNELLTDLKRCIHTNKKLIKLLKFIFIMIGVLILILLGNAFCASLNGELISENEKIINEGTNLEAGHPAQIFENIIIVFLGPLVEEIVYRLIAINFIEFICKKFIHNEIICTILAIIAAGALFGSIHDTSSYFFFAYSFMGILFGAVYKKYNNIWASAACHIFNNSICTLLQAI